MCHQSSKSTSEKVILERGSLGCQFAGGSVRRKESKGKERKGEERRGKGKKGKGGKARKDKIGKNRKGRTGKERKCRFLRRWLSCSRDQRGSHVFFYSIIFGRFYINP